MTYGKAASPDSQGTNNTFRHKSATTPFAQRPWIRGALKGEMSTIEDLSDANDFFYVFFFTDLFRKWDRNLKGVKTYAEPTGAKRPCPCHSEN